MSKNKANIPFTFNKKKLFHRIQNTKQTSHVHKLKKKKIPGNHHAQTLHFVGQVTRGWQRVHYALYIPHCACSQTQIQSE